MKRGGEKFVTTSLHGSCSTYYFYQNVVFVDVAVVVVVFVVCVFVSVLANLPLL